MSGSFMAYTEIWNIISIKIRVMYLISEELDEEPVREMIMWISSTSS
jgi:hypothetical protein